MSSGSMRILAKKGIEFLRKLIPYIKDPEIYYGFLFGLDIVILSLHTLSILGLPFYLVIRRVSYYTTVPFNTYYAHMIYLFTSLMLLAILFLWRRYSWKTRTLVTIYPLTVIILITLGLTNLLLLSILILVSIVYLMILSRYSVKIYRGFTASLASLAVFSMTIFLLKELGLVVIRDLLLYDTPNYLFYSLQRIIPYLLLFLLSLSIVFVALLLVEKRSFENNRAARSWRNDFIYIFTGSALSLVLYMIPYTRVINPRALIATTDIVVYVNALQKMNSSPDPLQAVINFFGDRPLYILALYYVQKILGLDPWFISTLSGWIWTPLLVLSIWFMSRRLFDERVGRYALLVSPVSSQILSFIYGGFQANQLNLAVVYASIGFLRSDRFLEKLVGVLLLVISSGIHLWSWIHLVSGVLLWLIIEAVRIRDRRSILTLIISIASISISAYIYMSLVGSLDKIMKIVMGTANRYINASFETRILGLVNTLSIYVWGIMSNSLLLLLAIGGHFIRFRERSMRTANAIDYMFIVTLPALYLLSLDMSLAFRLVLDLPLQVLAAVLLSRTSLESRVAFYSLLLYMGIYASFNAPPR